MVDKFPMTPAIRVLMQAKADYAPYLYAYKEKSGAAGAARELDVPLASVVKSIVLEDEKGAVVLVLMPGDKEVSTKKLARALKCKSFIPCSAQKVQKVTGYLPGGCSPFGLRNDLPILSETSVFNLDQLFINGGKRGFILGLSPLILQKILSPRILCVAAA